MSYYVRRTIPRRFHRPLRTAVARVTAPLLHGSARHCPICGGDFRKFLGAPGRQDAICPRCCSSERHRYLWVYLRDSTDFFTADRRVLHVAAENCLERRFRAAENLHYVTADLDAPADVKLDLTNASFESESFDVIFCLHVLEHIPDDAAAMRELGRMLRPGGFAVVDVPLDDRNETYEPDARDPKQRFRLLGQHDHVRFYGRADLPRRLESAGFDVTVERVSPNLSRDQLRRDGLKGDETLHICRRADGSPSQLSSEQRGRTSRADGRIVGAGDRILGRYA